MSNIDKMLTGNTLNPFKEPLALAKNDSGRYEINLSGAKEQPGFTKEQVEYLAMCINNHQQLLKALNDVKKALESNPNFDAQQLFECCSNATEIAHNALYDAQSLNTKSFIISD